MRRALLIATLVVVATIFLSPMRRDLFVGDETKYSQVIREMRETRSYLVPQLNGRPYTHKPPVHFWIITALTYVFGYQSLWPFVLQSIVSYVALLFVVRAFARELFGDDAGPPAMFVLGTSILAWGIAQTARMDASFTLFISLAALYYARFVRTGLPRNLYFGAAMIAVAILIKGPMAFVMIALLIVFYSVWLRRARAGAGPAQRGAAKWLIAFLIILVGPLLWLVPALIAGGKQYAHDLLIKQNVGRALNAWTHKEPFWYYLAHSPATLFPWFFLFVIAVIAAYKRRDAQSASDATFDAHRSAVAFCLAWIAAVLVPFSLLSSKLDVYMLPTLVPVSLMVGQFLATELNDRYARSAVMANRLLTSFLLLLMIALPLIAGTHLVKATPELELIRPALPIFAWSSAALLAVALAFMFSRDRTLLRSSIALGLAAIAPLVVATTLLMPQINEISSTRPLIAALAKYDLPPQQMALFACPNLWTRDMPERLFRVQYVGEDVLETDPATLPAIVAARSSRARQLGDALRNYVHVETVRMIGKDFHVYRRR